MEFYFFCKFIFNILIYNIYNLLYYFIKVFWIFFILMICINIGFIIIILSKLVSGNKEDDVEQNKDDYSE